MLKNKEEIISFLEWVDDHFFRMTKPGVWYALDDLEHERPLTTGQLYEKYFADSE